MNCSVEEIAHLKRNAGLPSLALAVTLEEFDLAVRLGGLLSTDHGKLADSIRYYSQAEINIPGNLDEMGSTVANFDQAILSLSALNAQNEASLKFVQDALIVRKCFHQILREPGNSSLAADNLPQFESLKNEAEQLAGVPLIDKSLTSAMFYFARVLSTSENCIESDKCIQTAYDMHNAMKQMRYSESPGLMSALYIKKIGIKPRKSQLAGMDYEIRDPIELLIRASLSVAAIVTKQKRDELFFKRTIRKVKKDFIAAKQLSEPPLIRWPGLIHFMVEEPKLWFD